MNALPVYDDRYVKTKRRIYTNFCGLNLPDDSVECESFTIVSIDSVLAYENNYYLQVYYLQVQAIEFIWLKIRKSNIVLITILLSPIKISIW